MSDLCKSHLNCLPICYKYHNPQFLMYFFMFIIHFSNNNCLHSLIIYCEFQFICLQFIFFFSQYLSFPLLISIIFFISYYYFFIYLILLQLNFFNIIFNLTFLSFISSMIRFLFTLLI